MDEQEFLRVISISDPVPTGLAAALSFREDAGSVSTGSSAEPPGDGRGVAARELPRSGASSCVRTCFATCSARGPGGWPGCTLSPPSGGPAAPPVRALEHAAHSRDDALVTDLLHRFAVPLIVAGDHGPLRRALASVGAHAAAADPGSPSRRP